MSKSWPQVGALRDRSRNLLVQGDLTKLLRFPMVRGKWERPHLAPICLRHHKPGLNAVTGTHEHTKTVWEKKRGRDSEWSGAELVQHLTGGKVRPIELHLHCINSGQITTIAATLLHVWFSPNPKKSLGAPLASPWPSLASSGLCASTHVCICLAKDS